MPATRTSWSTTTSFAPGPVGLVTMGVTLTLASFDLIMSLDPHWFSTIFGVYYFSGGFLGFFALLIVAVMTLQRYGYIRHSVGPEHFHDLGKFLFGFVFFWGYIAFSQYMLLWYASIPEETEWFARHGATTNHNDITGYSYVILAILFGHLVIPFLGLLSRHVKRNRSSLLFWAVWVLVFHFIDLYWVVMPELSKVFRPGFIDITAFVAVGAIFLGSVVRTLSQHSLIPVNDPRLPDAMAFENI